MLLLALWGCVWPGAGAWATDKVVEVTRLDRGSASMTEYFAVLEDPGQSYTLADVRAPELASRFATGQLPAEALSHGFTTSAHWLRLTLRNSSDQPVQRMLELGYPLLSSVQLHHPAAAGGFQSVQTGAAEPFSTRPYPNRLFVFPLSLPAGSEQVLYLRLASSSAMLVPVRLWEPQAFHAHERADYVAQAWYFGMASALILFNLLLLIALRDRVYLTYTVFALGTALTISASNGFGKEFVWSDTRLWSDIAISVLGALTLAALLLFMRRMLNTRQVVPRLDWMARVLTGILLLLPIGFAVSLRTFVIPSTLVIAATALLTLVTGIRCAFFKRQRIAVFFVLAISVWLGGVLLVSLKTIQLLPVNFYTMNGYQIGSALEMLLLAFALAYRFILIRRQATADVQRANAALEDRLREREVELTASHERLREIERRQALSDERQRLMQDMHDGLGSSLSSALWVVERGRLDEAEVAQVLKGCIDDLKLAIDSMEPVDADLLLLLATLRFRLQPRLEASGITLRWEVQDLPPLAWLNPKNSLHILRILQEAYTNIIKHTSATEIRFTTRALHDEVEVTVADNGQGFSVEQALQSGGRGLSNQIRRAQAIGATVTWASDGSGTRLTLRLPILREVSEAAELMPSA